jgi:hypothetical protein
MPRAGQHAGHGGVASQDRPVGVCSLSPCCRSAESMSAADATRVSSTRASCATAETYGLPRTHTHATTRAICTATRAKALFLAETMLWHVWQCRSPVWRRVWGCMKESKTCQRQKNSAKINEPRVLASCRCTIALNTQARIPGHRRQSRHAGGCDASELQVFEAGPKKSPPPLKSSRIRL